MELLTKSPEKKEKKIELTREDRTFIINMRTCATILQRGTNMNVTQEIKRLHGQLIEVETAFAEFIRKMENNTVTVERRKAEEYEVIYPIAMTPSVFKGKKPIAVNFGNERVKVCSWQMVLKEIVRRCNEDPENHKALMNLRDKISGRERTILSAKKANMRRPFEIGTRLYIETHYDTETLLRILLVRVLDEVGYDYGNITVAVRNVL